MLYTIVWQKPGDDRKWIPVDEKLYGKDANEAKQVAGPFMSQVDGTGMKPVEVLKISEEKFKMMLEGSDTPLETFLPDDPNEFEMLQLNA